MSTENMLMTAVMSTNLYKGSIQGHIKKMQSQQHNIDSEIISICQIPRAAQWLGICPQVTASSVIHHLSARAFFRRSGSLAFQIVKTRHYHRIPFYTNPCSAKHKSKTHPLPVFTRIHPPEEPKYVPVGHKRQEELPD